MAQLQADKVYDLKLTGTDLATIAQGLDEVPRKLSQPVLEKLMKQVAPAPAEPPKPDPKAEK